MHQYIEFAIRHWDLFLTLFIIIGLLVAPTINRRVKGFQEVDPQGAVALINHQDAVVLDVRESNEFAEGHVEDSIHLPLGNLDKHLGQLESLRSRPLVVACRSGARSSRACGILRRQGFEQVYNLKGGMMAWQNSGLPLTKGGKKKKQKKSAKA